MHYLRTFALFADYGQSEDGKLIGAIVAGIALVAAVGVLVYLLRYLQRCRGVSDRAMSQMDEQSEAIARGREHMRIAEHQMNENSKAVERSREHMEIAERRMDENSKAIERSREHMEIAEHHMAAVEKKLDEVIDQLKRRPLS